MYYSDQSKQNLSQCHELLQQIFNEVIKHYDHKIICGYRNENEQNEAFKNKKSKLKYPNSKHNKIPSMAVDACPYPIDWADTLRFAHFVGFVKATSIPILSGTQYELTSGIDWDNDTDIKEHSFLDFPHFELNTKTQYQLI